MSMILYTSLDGRPRLFYEKEYSYNNENMASESFEKNIYESRPFHLINWPDQNINYDTRKHFNMPGRDTFIIRKGTTAAFTFKIKHGNSHFEVGFMDKDFNTIEVLSLQMAQGALTGIRLQEMWKDIFIFGISRQEFLKLSNYL